MDPSVMKSSHPKRSARSTNAKISLVKRMKTLFKYVFTQLPYQDSSTLKSSKHEVFKKNKM